MSLKIIKAGILDSVQDLGRLGYQHLGINPGGVMDFFSSQLANILVGNSRNQPVIELHFPSPTITFEQNSLVALCGADFSATINGNDISPNQPIIISKNSTLQFHKWKYGARCYLSVKEKLKIAPRLNSYSTNLKVAAGGYQGRALQKNDVIYFLEESDYSDILLDRRYFPLPYKADINWTRPSDTIFVLPGNEWNWLSGKSKSDFGEEYFTISNSADRMGYRLSGKLIAEKNDELISSAVSFGTIQLLPNGELIILMADHQTTGGYPRIAHVITAHLPFIAQMRSGDKIKFQFIDQQKAENLLSQQEQHLQQLQNACTFKLQEYFS